MSPTGNNRLLRPLPLAAVIVVVVLASYAGSFDGAFVSDDIRRVEQNPLLESLDWHGVKQIFSTFDGANYMPLKVLSLAVDRRLWGPEPTGFHATNVLLHAGCALLVFSVLLRLGCAPLAACLVALLWAVHPLQVESVAWISERKNVLSGLFLFAAFRVYLEFTEKRRPVFYAACLALFGLALLSKMTAMVLPALCLAYEAVWRRRLQIRDLLYSLPLFAGAAAVGIYNLAGNPIHGGSYHGGSALVTWTSSSVVVFRYLGKLLAPFDLRPWYDVPLRGSPLDPAVLLSLAGLVAIAALTARWIGQGRREAFWVLWFAVTLLPMLNVIPFRSMMNDRYMHLALLGPVALAATLAARLRPGAARRAIGWAAAAAVLACAALTVRQVEVWSDPITLWTRGAATPILGPEPGLRTSFQDEKLVAAERIVAESPDDAVWRNNLGALYYQANRIPAAVEQLEEAHRLLPGDPFILINVGRVRARTGRFDAAVRAQARAVELRPHHYLAHYFLARTYLMSGDPAGARRELDACVRINPKSAESGALRPELDALRRLEAAR